MRSKLKDLEHRIGSATGPDRNLDQAIADIIGSATGELAAAAYTSSVDTSLALIGAALPAWHWHVGHGPSGILPYASLRKTSSASDAEDLRVEASAATVPLALLHAAVKALIMDKRNP